MPNWTVATLGQSAAQLLSERGIDHGRLDADLLLAEALGIPRLELYLSFDMPVDDDQRAHFRGLIKRRLAREPLAYILGRRDFLDWTFAVNPAVLIPRPETEHLVLAAAKILRPLEKPRVLEIGVGSGCVLLSLLKLLPNLTALGVDISAAALEVAQENAAQLDVATRVTWFEGDAFAALDAADRGSFDLIISNPPYICPEEAASLEPDVREFEPHAALFYPGDGFAFHRRLIEEGRPWLKEQGAFAFELPGIEGARERFLVASEQLLPTWSCAILPDYAGRDRVFLALNQPWPADLDRHQAPS